MGINKLAFFAVEAFLLKRDQLLTNAKIEAWEHGPVFRELYQSFKSYGNGSVLGRAKVFSTASEEFQEALICLSDQEESFLREVITPLMFHSAAELRALSHERNGAWYRVWWYEGHANPGMEISPSLLMEAGGGRHD
ncbi:Panacea domain-containing protein [Sphingomonas sp. S2-65]|uniref:Panacea domain-containing protein n=1 Tax=Sphingomonas sp. S2-65 TaxID=2903960 RepID=UPI001F24B803|nr:SocA family protein [Sphingomonas sp. S2-65]UYY59946.1 Panacea domain-containing protein [Sphingomonas sp. S2-65]